MSICIRCRFPFGWRALRSLLLLPMFMWFGASAQTDYSTQVPLTEQTVGQPALDLGPIAWDILPAKCALEQAVGATEKRAQVLFAQKPVAWRNLRAGDVLSVTAESCPEFAKDGISSVNRTSIKVEAIETTNASYPALARGPVVEEPDQTTRSTTSLSDRLRQQIDLHDWYLRPRELNVRLTSLGPMTTRIHLDGNVACSVPVSGNEKFYVSLRETPAEWELQRVEIKTLDGGRSEISYAYEGTVSAPRVAIRFLVFEIRG